MRKVIIREILEREIEIDGECTTTEAIEKATAAYLSNDVVLTADDFVEYSIKVEERS